MSKLKGAILCGERRRGYLDAYIPLNANSFCFYIL